MIDGLNEYLDFIKKEYTRWMIQCRTDVRERMTEEFQKSVRFEQGSKYIKVIAGTSVHSFICLKDNGKFKKGDILKAAGWSSPARNFARGNVIAKQFGQTRWTGAM